jgi:hypothetical protein
MTTVPVSVDEVDESWLTATLSDAGVLDGTVREFRAEQIGAGIGIMGLLYRLHLDVDGDGPATVVLKVPSVDPGARHVARTFRFYEKEVGFYRDLAVHTPADTPEAYFARHDPEADDFCLLLGDVDDAVAHSQVEGCPPDAAILAARALARHHAALADSPVLEEHTWIPWGSDSPTPEGVVQGVTEGWEGFRRTFPEHASPELGEIVTRYLRSVPELLRMPEGRPVTLVHGDYRLDNLFFGDAGSITIIDWQICTKGPFAYDLAYFVTQSLTVDDRRAHEQEIIDAYLRELDDLGCSHDRDHFMEDYRRTAMFCLCYPLQSGAVELVNDRARELVSDMFERSMAAVEDHRATEFLVD